MDAKLQSGIDWKDIPEQDRNKILNEITDFLEKYPTDEYFAAKALWHLAKLGVVWAKLPFTFRNKLERHIVNIKVLGRNVSQALCGFRLMRSKWRDINSDTQRVFINTLIKHFEFLDAIDVCNIVYSLGKMEVKWKNLPQTLKVSTLTAISRSTYHMNDFGISNTIWALGHCGVNWEKDVSHHLRMSLFERILEVSPLSPNSLSSTLGGFSRMNLQWKALPLSFRLAVQTVFEADEKEGEISALPSSGERTVSSIVYSLGRLHADQTSLSLSSQDTMMKSISAVSSHLTMQGISNVLYGLALMKWKWADIPTVTRNDLIATIMKALPNMDDRPLSNIVWSLGQLEATWSDEVTQQSSSSQAHSNITRKNLLSLRDASSLLLSEEYIDTELDGFGNYDYFESKLNNNNSNNSNNNTSTGDEENDNNNRLSGSSSSSNNLNKESELSSQLFSRLMEAIERVAPSVHDQGISQLMVGFVKMGCSWTVIPKQIKDQMNQRALMLGGELGYYSVSACLWCLRVEGLLWPSEDVEERIIADNANLFNRLSSSGKYKMTYSNNVKYTLKDPLTALPFNPSKGEYATGSSTAIPPTPSTTSNSNANTNSALAMSGVHTATTTTSSSSSSSSSSSNTTPISSHPTDPTTTSTILFDTTTTTTTTTSTIPDTTTTTSSSVPQPLVPAESQPPSDPSPPYTNEEQFLFILIRSLELSLNKQPVTPLYSMSVILNSLSSMGATWNRLSTPLRSVILNSILSSDCQSNPTGVACYIYFLAKIGFTWDDSNISKKKQIFTIIEHTMHKMSERLFSSLILGLSMLGEGFGSKSTSTGIRAAVFENIIRVHSTMKPQAVIAVLKALSKQKDILWVTFPVELRDALNAAIIRVLRTESRKNQLYLAVDIIGCLSKLGVTIKDITEEMKKYLFGALLRPLATNESTFSEFALALTGLAKLDVMFSELPETLQVLINQQLLLSLPSFDCTELENCIWSLSKMKLSWNNLSSDIRSSIVIALESKFLLFSHSEFTWTLWALGKMTLRWDDCSIKLKKSILKRMQEILPTFENHELGTVLLTFEKLEFPLNNFPLRLRNEIFFGIESVANVMP